MIERKEDKTTSIEPDDLLLKFKRNGHFDRQRKHLYESFVNNELKNDFSQTVTSLCKSIMDSHNGKFTDKLTMQKFLMGKLGEKADLFDSVKAHLKQEMESDTFKEVVNAGLYEAYDQLSAQPIANETASTENIKSDVETPKPKKAKTSKYDLLGDIISGSVRSKEDKSTPSTLVKPPADSEGTPSTEHMQIDDDKQANVVAAGNNAIEESALPEANEIVQILPDINDDSDLSSAPESETESESDTDSKQSSDVEGDEAKKLNAESNEEYAQVFLKGQKLAGLIDDKWHVMIVKNFDKRTGMYLCRMERDKNELSLPFDNLRHFNHVDKELKEGDEVLSLYRLKQGHGLSSVFYPAKIESVRSRILSVHFKDKKETMIMKKNEILQL